MSQNINFVTYFGKTIETIDDILLKRIKTSFWVVSL